MADVTDAGNGSDLTASPLRDDSSNHSAAPVAAPSRRPSAPVRLALALPLLAVGLVAYAAGVLAGFTSAAFRGGLFRFRGNRAAEA